MIKKITRTTLALTIAATTFAFSTSALAEADGAALYMAKSCQTCHGADADTPTVPTYPKLAGQNEEYLLAQMKDIKSGARNNGATAAMKAITASVTDEEMAAIAKYIAGLGAEEKPAADAKPAEEKPADDAKPVEAAEEKPAESK